MFIAAVRSFRFVALVVTIVTSASTAVAQTTVNFSQLRKAAEHGDVSAQYELGIAYRDGRGVVQDLVDASVWLSFAAYFAEGPDRAPYRTADRELADRLSYEQTRDASHRSVALVRRLAENGRGWAQFSLAMAYYDGIQALPKDLDQAIRWFQKSANQSYALSQFMLGMAYLRGNGVAADQAKGIDWLRKAAIQGHAHAQLVVGTAFFNGNGVPKDVSQALQWWRKSADQGLAQAQANLGTVHLQGDNGIERDYQIAALWYLKAASQGLAGAQGELGELYEKGLGVLQDSQESLRWYRLAAGGGDTLAQYKLGFFYRDGSGVARDLVEAHKWANLAASRATADNQKPFADAREAIAQSMTPAQIAEAQARAREWMMTFERAGRVIEIADLPAPPVPPSGPLRVGGEITPPAKTKDVEPVYPPIAISARVQGLITLEATIDPNGKVVDIKPLGTPQPLLVQAAIDAVKQWEYAPTLFNGVPVPLIMTVTVNFALK